METNGATAGLSRAAGGEASGVGVLEERKTADRRGPERDRPSDARDTTNGGAAPLPSATPGLVRPTPTPITQAPRTHQAVLVELASAFEHQANDGQYVVVDGEDVDAEAAMASVDPPPTEARPEPQTGKDVDSVTPAHPLRRQPPGESSGADQDEPPSTKLRTRPFSRSTLQGMTASALAAVEVRASRLITCSVLGAGCSCALSGPIPAPLLRNPGL